jgi:hypothetical protein
MSEKRRYNRDFLERYCKENNITYENIDETIKVTRQLHIKGDCKGENCIEKFDKVFRMMIENSGPYCEKCTSKNRLNKLKNNCLEKYGVENPFQRKEVKDKITKTNIDRYGVKSCLQLKEMRSKIKKTNLEKYGVEHAMQNNKIKEKIKNTFMNKYGVKNPSLNLSVQAKRNKTFLDRYGVSGLNCIAKLNVTKDKIKKTCLKKYGVTYSLQNKDIREKGKQTCLKKYGEKYACQAKIIKEKIKKTFLKKYGYEYATQTEGVKEKIKKTNLEKYGVEYVSQNAEISEKQYKNSYKVKEYTYPSGKVIKCQGYEPFALDILIRDHKITEEDIITSKKEVPEIWYKDEKDKIHRYYVDIFIKSLNKFIEVKSTWTYMKDREKLEFTKNAVKDKGFLYECWVIDYKGNIIG